MSRVVNWAHGRCQPIRDAFGPRKRQSNAFGITAFIAKAVAYELRVAANPVTKPSRVNDDLRRAHRAASALDKAMKRLSAEALRQIVVAGAALESTSSNPRERPALHLPPHTWAGKRQEIEALKRSLGVLVRDIKKAREKSNPSRGLRAKDMAALRLASYLFFWWQATFRKRGSIVKGGEFHRVADAVAKLYGLRIGPKILAKAAIDPAAELPSPQ